MTKKKESRVQIEDVAVASGSCESGAAVGSEVGEEKEVVAAGFCEKELEIQQPPYLETDPDEPLKPINAVEMTQEGAELYLKAQHKKCGPCSHALPEFCFCYACLAGYSICPSFLLHHIIQPRIALLHALPI